MPRHTKRKRHYKRTHRIGKTGINFGQVVVTAGIRGISSATGGIVGRASDNLTKNFLSKVPRGIAKIVLGSLISGIAEAMHVKRGGRHAGLTALEGFGDGISAIGGVDIAEKVMPKIASPVEEQVEGIGQNLEEGFVVDTDYEEVTGTEQEEALGATAEEQSDAISGLELEN
jgi:hypothetical protein